MSKITAPSARRSGLVVQQMDQEVLVYDVTTNKAHCLNETAANVWNLCDGTRDVSQIAADISVATGTSVNDDFVWLAIDQLSESDLLESGVTARFAGRSRRDVIKDIGLASMVALPVIASLVAPPNALSSSSCVCTSPAACAPQSSCPSTTNCNGLGVCTP
jgi:hypothetical protein